MTDIKTAMAAVDAAASELGSTRAAKIAKMRALACAAVSIAMKEGKHGEHCYSEASATAIWSVAELLTAAMDAKPVTLDPAMKQASAPGDRAKAEAVARALGRDGEAA